MVGERERELEGMTIGVLSRFGSDSRVYPVAVAAYVMAFFFLHAKQVRQEGKRQLTE